MKIKYDSIDEEIDDICKSLGILKKRAELLDLKRIRIALRAGKIEIDYDGTMGCRRLGQTRSMLTFVKDAVWWAESDERDGDDRAVPEFISTARRLSEKLLAAADKLELKRANEISP